MSTSIIGTHNGRLDDHERGVRAIKNQRNRSRVHPKGGHGLDMPVPGSNRGTQTRLFVRGNRAARGLGR